MIWSGGANPLQVFVDGRRVGRIWINRVSEFSVTPGAYSVSVKMSHATAGPLLIRVGPHERVELLCGSNQAPMHPLMSHATKVFGIVIAFALIGLVFPKIGAVMQANFEVEFWFASGLWSLGMAIHGVRAYRAGALWMEIDLHEKGG